MQKYHKSFSLIEIIFGIVIVAIITSIALPKLFSTSHSSSLIKLRSDIATIQNGIVNYKQNTIMKNLPQTLDSLDEDDTHLFSKILARPIVATNIYPFWSKNDNESYIFHFDSKNKLEFIYNPTDFTFLCNTSESLCLEVVE